MTRLGDLAEMLRGVTFKPAQLVAYGDEDAVACLRTKNVQLKLDLEDLLFVPKSVVKQQQQYVRPGDIIVSSANSWNLVGKCSWVAKIDGPMTFGGFVSNLRVVSDAADSRYVFHWFSSPRVQSLVRSFGRQTTNISNLNIARTLDLDIPLPPLPEQRRIASILDQADKLRHDRTRAVELLSEVPFVLFKELTDRQSGRAELRVARFGDLGRVVTGGTPPSSSLGQFGDLVPFVTPGDLGSKGVKRHLSEEGAKKAKTVRAGSLLVCCIGATVGKMGIARMDSGFNQQINAVEWGPAVLSRYGYFAAQSIRSTIIGAATSTTMPIVNKSQFQAIEIPVVDLDSQRTFDSQVLEIEYQLENLAKSARGFDELFASLQHRAFSGQL